MLSRDFMSHRRGGQLCEWYKISKKIIKSSNVNGSLILKYQWIQKGVTHHGSEAKPKRYSSLKTRKTLCDGVTAELINKKINKKIVK